jgi:hypothetical protein
MEMAMTNHFIHVFGRAVNGGSAINFVSLGIQPMQLEDLDADIGVDEVLNAIKEMPADKAPGPDGFTGAFYKSSWSVIQEDVMAAVRAFQDGDQRGLHRLNNGLIV